MLSLIIRSTCQVVDVLIFVFGTGHQETSVICARARTERTLKWCPDMLLLDAMTDNPLPFVLIENPGDELYLRQRMVQMLFERFAAPGVVVMNSAVLTMKAYDESGDKCGGSGVVVDIGHAGARVCIVDNFKIVNFETTAIGGQCIDEFLFRHLHDDDGRVFTTTSERELCRRVKHEICYCAS